MVRTKPVKHHHGSNPSASSTSQNLPPPRQKEQLKRISPPLSSTRLHRLIYVLVFTTALLAAYYSYRFAQYKAEVGGWWDVALGRWAKFGGGPGGPVSGTARRPLKEETVEDRINSLAEALGMPSKDLASAIAVAVREYVPPASLSSIAAKETGPAVEAMLKTEGYTPSSGTQDGTGFVGSIFSSVENFVGMDEP